MEGTRKRHAPPPGSWKPARALARHAAAPFERLLRREAASGILLLLATATALTLANSPWAAGFAALWHTPLGVRIGPLVFERDLHFWVNEGLMTVFFFVVGLEIRREMHEGALKDLRRAALPLAAAVGGMLLPACVFLVLNVGRPSATGWGIPMATDIAFAIGVLSLLGNRVPPGLRIFLLSLAVIDDVGAILVIAIFYSSSLAPVGFLVLGLSLAAIPAMQLMGIRSAAAYIPVGAIVWGGAYWAGIHPTLGGVLVGLLTPVRPWFGRTAFVEQARKSIRRIQEHDRDERDATFEHLESLDQARRESISPVDRMLRALHGWAYFGVVPLFALANAGVAIGEASFSGDPLRVFVGAAAGLVLGKPAGILLFCWLATRLGWATLPEGVRWSQVGLVGGIAGIGFTMSIFIAQLAFPAGASLETAKVGILAGSGVAAVAGYLLGRLTLAPGNNNGRGQPASPPLNG